MSAKKKSDKGRKKARVSVKKATAAKKVSGKAAKDVKTAKGAKATKARTIEALKGAIASIGEGFQAGSEKVADAIVARDKDGRSRIDRRIKEETLGAARGMVSGVKKSFKSVKAEDVINSALFEIGRFSKATKDTCTKIFKDIME